MYALRERDLFRINAGWAIRRWVFAGGLFAGGRFAGGFSPVSYSPVGASSESGGDSSPAREPVVSHRLRPHCSQLRQPAKTITGHRPWRILASATTHACNHSHTTSVITFLWDFNRTSFHFISCSSYILQHFCYSDENLFIDCWLCSNIIHSQYYFSSVFDDGVISLHTYHLYRDWYFCWNNFLIRHSRLIVMCRCFVVVSHAGDGRFHYPGTTRGKAVEQLGPIPINIGRFIEGRQSTMSV